MPQRLPPRLRWMEIKVSVHPSLQFPTMARAWTRQRCGRHYGLVEGTRFDDRHGHRWATRGGSAARTTGTSIRAKSMRTLVLQWA